MNITKLITSSIVVAGISLTTLAELANARGTGTHSVRGGDGSFVNSTFVLVNKSPNKPKKIGTNTVIFKEAIQDFIKTSFNTISLAYPVVFNPKGLPVDLAGCRSEGITYENGIYKDASGNPINFQFDAQGKVTSPSCAKTVEQFIRVRSADLKVQLIENNPNSPDDDQIKYIIVKKTQNMEVVNEIGILDLPRNDVDQNKAINDISYIVEKNILEKIFNVRLND